MEPQNEFFLNSESNVSLQENFLKFLAERKKQIKNKNFKANKQIKNRDSTEYREELRQKFIDRVKHYIGIPYAKRYHDPGTEAYNSPIFLDCCGLVRQVMDDLKEDFGFRIGRWNQAYQYDVLGDEIPFEEMRPGDLIFYSATYYDTKKRKQLHDMVHVEVFMGGETGESTIGARWFKGAVRVFDSYKFVSTNYYDIKFHYKSLDLWLRGICESQCSLHCWREDRKYQWLTHNSIFAQEDDNDTNESTPQKEQQESSANIENPEGVNNL